MRSAARYFTVQSESMSDLHKALGDIGSIRRQVARTTEFRGYGPATLATTAAFAVLAALVQGRLVPDPQNHLGSYLGVWIWTAVASAALIGAQMHTRSRSPWAMGIPYGVGQSLVAAILLFTGTEGRDEI